MIVGVLRGLVAVGSLYAAACALSGWLRVRQGVALSAVVGGYAVLMTLFGMVGALNAGVWLLVAAGYGLLMAAAVTTKRPLMQLLMPQTAAWVCLGVLAVLAAYLQTRMMDSYADYTHWYVIVRNMFLTQRLPVEGDSMVLYRDYIPGGACFIYYLCRASGLYGEHAVMLAHRVMQVCLLAPVVELGRGRKGWTALCGAAVLCMSVQVNMVNCVLVDVSLASALAGGIAMLYVLRNDGRKMLLVWPVALACTALKNGGVLFSVLLAAACGVMLWKPRGRRRALLAGLTMAASAALLLILWKLHTNAVFDSTLMNYHSMSLERYAQEYAGKGGWSSLTIILPLLWQSLWSWTDWPGMLLLLLMASGTLCASALKRGGEEAASRRVAHITMAGVGLFVIWQMALIGTYMFSMGETAIDGRLASYDRYAANILPALLVLLLLVADQYAQHGRMDVCKRGAALCCAGVIVLLTAGAAYSAMTDVHVTLGESLRRDLRGAISETELPISEAGRCLIVVTDAAPGDADRYQVTESNNILFQRLVARFELWIQNTKMIDNGQASYGETLEKYLQGDGGLVIFLPGTTAETDAIMANQGLSAGQQVVMLN